MPESFDPYHKWLGIPPSEQPPDHYRLLGLGLFESDPDVIEQAADRQMAHVQTHRTGPHSALSQTLLNELAAAKLCLLQPANKAAYDRGLKEKLLARPRPQPVAIPVARPLVAAAPVDFAELQIHAPSPGIGRPAPTSPSGLHRLAAGALAGAIAVAALAVWLVNGGDRPSREKTVGSKSSPPRAANTKAKRANQSAAPAVAPARPTRPAREDNTIDLVTRIGPVRDSEEGTWRLSDGKLVSLSDNAVSKIQIPADVPASYTFSFEARRLAGHETLAVYLPIADKQTQLVRQAMVALDASGASCCDFHLLDGRGAGGNETVHRGGLFSDKPRTVRCTVDRDSIRVTCDGDPVLIWTGNPRRFSIDPRWAVKRGDRIYLAADSSSYEISNLRLTAPKSSH